MKLTIDLESRSPIDLRKTNEWVYAENPATQIMCFAFKKDNGAPRMYIPEEVLHLYDVQSLYGRDDFTMAGAGEFIEAINSAEFIEAHNLSFEVALWTRIMHKRYGFPDLREEPYFSKLRCSASVAAAHSLPRALGRVGAALHLPIQKDDEGHKLMLKMCKPRIPRKAEKEADPNWADRIWYHETPEDLLRQAQYCAQDVNAEYTVSEYLGGLPEAELKVWRLDQKANWHGVVVDQDLCRKMITVRDEYTKQISAEFKQITGLSPSQTTAFAKWLTSHGVVTDTVDKERIDELLDFHDACQTGPFQRALEIRQQYAKTSLKKLDSALKLVSADGRMRSTLMYHGAGTGRWSGKGMQLQNLPSRNLIKSIDTCTALLRAGATIDTISTIYPGEEQLALSSCIRGVLRSSPGNTLYAADFSAIEGRVLAWLAGDQHIVQGYIDGLDMYKVAASSVYGKPYDKITKAERQVGKIPELGGGYGGGWRAYAGFARKEKLKCPPEIVASIRPEDYWDWWIPDEKRTEKNRYTQAEAEYCKWFSPIVKAWRANRPGTKALWDGLQEACINAVENPGEMFGYAGIWYGVDKKDFLRCRLPSGRCLFYYKPRIIKREGRKQITYMGTDSKRGGKWSVIFSYGGKLCVTGETLILTLRGAVPILELRSDDKVWDGENWVYHHGIVEKGKAEVGEWLGIRITEGHRITDGNWWKRVTDLDERCSLDALKWARDSVLSPLFSEGSETIRGHSLSATAVENTRSVLERCLEDELNAVERADRSEPETPDVNTTTSFRRMNSEIFGPIDIPEWCHDVLTRITELLKTTEDGALRFVLNGSEIAERFLSMRELSKTGTSSDLIWTASTTTETTNPETSGFAPDPRTVVTEEQVYDLYECGPNYRYTVLTDQGPVVIHNCENVVQAIARDLMAESMITIHEADLGIDLLFTVHDEIVEEGPEGAITLEQFEGLMEVCPDWASGCPIGAEGWIGDYYRK